MDDARADPAVLAIVHASPDDEPESEEERAAVEAARREPGPGTAHEEVLRESGVPSRPAIRKCLFWKDDSYLRGQQSCRSPARGGSSS